MTGTLHRASIEFQRQFKHAPVWAASAPGRVNIIGEHTDYNLGFVLPMVIDRRTFALARPNSSNFIRMYSSYLQESNVIDLKLPHEKSISAPWSNYIRGVVSNFLCTAPIHGMDLLIESTIPPGGGLSSSAALEVAVATLLEQASGTVLDKGEKARLCQRAEHEFVGVPCGLMDQTASIFGREGDALLIDCESMCIQYIPMEKEEVSILIINSRVSHQLAAGEYGRRRDECKQAATRMKLKSLRAATQSAFDLSGFSISDVIARRARHVFSENQRTLQAANALRDRNWEETGRLMYASHESLRADFEVSCSELDTIVRAAQSLGVSNGVFGCRMTGGGFGGCAVALVRSEAAELIGSAIGKAYKSATGIEPAIFVSAPSAGAQAHALGGGP